MHVKDDEYIIGSYGMVHWYVRDNEHGLTIIQVVLYGQRFVVMVDLGSNGSSYRRYHA
jgi:hypothetical protein